MKQQRFARYIRYLKARIWVYKEHLREDTEQFNRLKVRFDKLDKEFHEIYAKGKRFFKGKYIRESVGFEKLDKSRRDLHQLLSNLAFDIEFYKDQIKRLKEEIKDIPLG